MSETRRKRRKLNLHMNALGVLLSDFYQFLERTPKPSDEEVRQTFICYHKRWKNYCVAKGLSDMMMEEFKRQVSETWKYKASESH